MKKISFVIIIFAHIAFSISSRAQDQKADSFLFHIQDKIYEAFIASFSDKDISELQKIQHSIQDLNSNSQIVNYWIPYSKYYESIFYLKNQDNKQAKKSIDDGIDLLSEFSNKNSESFALLAHLQSFSIQFEKGMSVIETSKEVLNNAEKALEMDKSNPRAWYVLACNDYYKPKQYGGGKKCEEYLLKTISTSENSSSNPYLPTWGISDAYALLIGYYIGNNEEEKAKETFDKGLLLFPNDYMINQYAGQFK